MRKKKIAEAAKTALKLAAALGETVLSAIVIAAMYAIYVPFGIGRSLFDRKAVRDFYDDVFFAIDGVSARMRKRKEERNKR